MGRGAAVESQGAQRRFALSLGTT